MNVHKDTLKIEVDEQNPDHVLVSFVFDALFDGRSVQFFLIAELFIFFNFCINWFSGYF